MWQACKNVVAGVAAQTVVGEEFARKMQCLAWAFVTVVGPAAELRPGLFDKDIGADCPKFPATVYSV